MLPLDPHKKILPDLKKGGGNSGHKPNRVIISEAIAEEVGAAQALFVASLRLDSEDPAPKDVGCAPRCPSWFCNLQPGVGGWAFSLLYPKGLVCPPLPPSASLAGGLFVAFPGGGKSQRAI